MNKGELRLEEVLDDDELISDIKNNANCTLAP
jgi:hypothetical protein